MLGLGADRHLPTVLLIDDDMVSREVIATVLTLSGYAVQTAADGAAALELLAAEKCVPKVILGDAQMPGLSGTRLIAELRSRGTADRLPPNRRVSARSASTNTVPSSRRS